MLYTEADLEASMDKIEVLNFHEEKDVLGIKFWAYNAGHVLGAAMFMIEIAGVKVYCSHLSLFFDVPVSLSCNNLFVLLSSRSCTLVIFLAKKTDI